MKPIREPWYSATKQRRARLTALATLTLACSGTFEAEEGEDEGLGELAQAITGGSLVSAAENTQLPFAAAVHFAACSGVKIGPRRFLTAAHCVSNGETTVRITNAIGGGNGPLFSIKAGTLFRHPSFDLGVEPGGAVKTGLYDVAVFEILDPNNVTASIPAVDVTGQHTGPGTAGLSFVGYGCDNDLPSHGGQKQKSVGRTAATNTNIAEHVHNITIKGGAFTCNGDSGGPLFRGSAVPRVTGINSYGVSGDRKSGFARLANVQEWLDDPAVNDLSHNSTGYFMSASANTGSLPPLRCASVVGTGATNNANVILDECDSYNTLITSNPPGWRLISTEDSHFAIVNRLTGTCMGVSNGSSAVGADVRAFTCPTSTPRNIPNSQRWTFETSSGSRIRVINKVSGKCLGTNDERSRGADVRQYECNGNSRQWVFTR